MKGFYNIVTDCLDKQVLEDPLRPALIKAAELNGDLIFQTYSFRDVYEKTLKLEESLKQMGLKPGDRIVLRLPNGLSFVSIFLAAIRAGFIPIPTSTLLTQGEFYFILSDSQAALAFVDIEAPVEFKDFKVLPVWVDSSVESIIPGTTISKQPEVKMTSADLPAYWLYTSGTQARPKAVIHAHRSIPAHDERVRQWMDLRPRDIVFNTSALNWSYGLTSGFLDAWRHGACVVTLRGKSKPEWIEKVVKHSQATILMSVPGIYRKLVVSRELNKNFSSLRVALSAGEKLPEEIRKKFQEQTGLSIREGLGMTEHSVFLIQSVNDKPQPDSCGKPVHAGAAVILRDDLTPAPNGETGILASAKNAPGLMLGYHQRDDETQQVMVGDYFLSGDLVRQDSDGNFYYVGRRDDVITSGGYRISPLEVETVINQLPGVVESGVKGVEIEPGKTILHAYLVLEANQTDSIVADIQALMEKNLAPYKRPKEFIIRNELPKTSNGKLKRSALC